MKKTLILSLIGILSFASCKKEGCTDSNATNYNQNAQKDDGSCTYATPPTNPPAPQFTELGSETTSANETVKLIADGPLTTGYARLYVAITDANGNTVTNANVSYAPLMDMGAMSHTCPVEQPTFNTTSGRYEGAAVFIMPSTAGTWTMGVSVNGNTVTFNISVAASNTKVVGSYSGTDGKTYFVSVMRPENWKVGMNDLDIMVHRRDDMMNFPADDDFDIVLTPEMVSMGHGSTGNINPTNTSNGHYTGEVNLTMAGDWRLHFELSKNGTVIHSDAFLDILF